MKKILDTTRVEMFMKSKNMSPYDFAIFCNVPVIDIIKLLNHDLSLTVESLYKIADSLGGSIHCLLEFYNTIN